MANLQLRFLLVSLFTSIVGEAQYVMQDAALMHYIDRRFQSLEVCAIFISGPQKYCITADEIESCLMLLYILTAFKLVISQIKHFSPCGKQNE